MYYQVPQFFIVGVAEVFAAITGLELAFSETPKRIKGAVMGVFMVMSGLGTFVAFLFLKLVNIDSNSKVFQLQFKI